MYLTMREIEKKYDGHWIFMTNCVKGDLNEIVGGVVIAFSKSKKPIAELWDKEYDSDIYFRYIGAIPDGMGVIL